MVRMRGKLSVLVLVALGGCGGGEDSATTPPSNTPPTNTPTAPAIGYTAGVFPASSTFAAQCATPRTGTDPSTSKPYPDTAGSTLAEKHFLRSWSNELYLWFNEITDRDPASVSLVAEYFNLLKTNAVLASGAPKDQFHFTYDSASYYALSQSGTSLGYGISWNLVQSVPPRRLVVQYVQAGSQAAAQGVTRGAELQTVDGVSVVSDNTQSGLETIGKGAFEPAAGSTHTLVFKARNGTQFTTELAAANVTFSAVPVVKVLPSATGNLGYLLFNDHTAASEQALVTAVNQLKSGNVQDLILDLRYNGGGYLAIASELAYMIAGPAATSGKTFEPLQFNSKYPSTDPVTGQALTPMPFLSSTAFSSTAVALPSLNLSRVYVLTSDDTCSASESLINGLRGIGMQVLQIGGNTCGKPYGFYPRDNCGTTYFSIQFRGVNAVGFGDYAAGFSSTRTTGEPQANLPGCSARDDFTRDLGDVQEERLRVAIEYRATGACTGTLSSVEPQASASSGDSGLPLHIPAEPWRQNRFLRP